MIVLLVLLRTIRSAASAATRVLRLLLALAVVACGVAAFATTPATAAAPAAPAAHRATSAHTPASARSRASRRAAMSADVLELVNRARAAGHTCGNRVYTPAPALRSADLLTEAATDYARRMGREGFFDHTAPDGTTLVDRLRAVGYHWSTYAEDIAAGYHTPKAVVKGWLESPGHCANIMDKRLTQIGVGMATIKRSQYTRYWVLDFGHP